MFKVQSRRFFFVFFVFCFVFLGGGEIKVKNKNKNDLENFQNWNFSVDKSSTNG